MHFYSGFEVFVAILMMETQQCLKHWLNHNVTHY